MSLEANLVSCRVLLAFVPLLLPSLYVYSLPASLLPANSFPDLSDALVVLVVIVVVVEKGNPRTKL